MTSAVIERRRRHVERRVAARRVGDRQQRAAGVAHLVGVALLDLDLVAAGDRRVDRRRRAGDDERDPGRARGQRVRVRADLVGDVAVGGHAVAADDDRVDLAAAHEPRGGAVDEQLVGDAGAPQLPDRQPRALQQRPRLAREHRQLAARGELGDDRQRRAGAAARERAGVAVREDPARPGQQVGAEAGDRRARGVLVRRGSPRPRRARPRRARAARRRARRPARGRPPTRG